MTPLNSIQFKYDLNIKPSFFSFILQDYKKPLEESNPPILSNNKISTLFHRLPEILQCHTLFRIALADCVRNWDRDEKIGDVFISSFSKPRVLDIYSGFINNFSSAMELAKMEAKRKSALSDFFKVKQISAHDRLSFFGLMVKPVQRFPQFILFLQVLKRFHRFERVNFLLLNLSLFIFRISLNIHHKDIMIECHYSWR